LYTRRMDSRNARTVGDSSPLPCGVYLDYRIWLPEVDQRQLQSGHGAVYSSTCADKNRFAGSDHNRASFFMRLNMSRNHLWLKSMPPVKSQDFILELAGGFALEHHHGLIGYIPQSQRAAARKPVRFRHDHHELFFADQFAIEIA